MIESHQELKLKIEHMEKEYDQHKIVFAALKALLDEPANLKSPLGFGSNKK